MTDVGGKLVVISGPSGAGKTSVCRALKGLPGVEFSISATTRAQRPGERDGVDYYFLEHDDFERRDLTSLRGGIMAGAPCPVDVMNAVRERMQAELDG